MLNDLMRKELQKMLIAKTNLLILKVIDMKNFLQEILCHGKKMARKF